MSPAQTAFRARLAHSILNVALGLGACACTHTLAFSDTAPIVVVGHPPPPPPPPPAPAEPAPKPKRVEVQQDQIVIREKIQFETDKADIKPDSFDLLNEIAKVMNDNPQLKLVSIEGHTDSEGSEAYNRKLSDKRAAAVRDYLVQHGVDAARLTTKGWGEDKPIADNATPEGREQNRRVEFIILKQDVVHTTYEIDPATGTRREVEQRMEPSTPTEPAEPETAPVEPATPEAAPATEDRHE